MPVVYGSLPLLLCLQLGATPALASSKSDSVRRLIDEGRVDVAQAKCDRLGAHLSNAEHALREVCAEAMFEAALENATVTTWVRFQLDSLLLENGPTKRQMHTFQKLFERQIVLAAGTQLPATNLKNCFVNNKITKICQFQYQQGYV